MARKCMDVKTGGSRVVGKKDQEQKPGGAKKRASKKSSKTKPVEGRENVANK